VKVISALPTNNTNNAHQQHTHTYAPALIHLHGGLLPRLSRQIAHQRFPDSLFCSATFSATFGRHLELQAAFDKGTCFVPTDVFVVREGIHSPTVSLLTHHHNFFSIRKFENFSSF
jgi:hypothetical protein